MSKTGDRRGARLLSAPCSVPRSGGAHDGVIDKTLDLLAVGDVCRERGIVAKADLKTVPDRPTRHTGESHEIVHATACDSGAGTRPAGLRSQPRSGASRQ